MDASTTKTRNWKKKWVVAVIMSQQQCVHEHIDLSAASLWLRQGERERRPHRGRARRGLECSTSRDPPSYPA